MSRLPDDRETADLEPRLEAMLSAAAAANHGHAVWRARKLAEAEDLVAMARRAHRIVLEALDLGTSLRAVVRLTTPVPLLPRAGALVTADRAVLGIRYPQEALLRRLPGTAFVQILYPAAVWLANAAAGPFQVLCLGVDLPIGIRVTELVHLAYRALSVQEIQPDERDRAGVLNVEAARWWQQNRGLAPLTRAPLFAPLETGVPR